MRSLRTQLVAAFLLIALIPLAALAISNSRILRRALTSTVNQALLSSVSQTAASIDEFIDRNRDAVRTEAQLPVFREFLLAFHQEDPNAEEIRDTALAALNALCRKDSVYVRSYALIDMKGNDLVDTDSILRGGNEATRGYFQEALSTGRPYVSPATVSRAADHGLSLYFSMPVSDAASRPVGVLRVEYDCAMLQRLISQSSEREGTKALSFLMDENGVCLAHNARPESLFRPLVSLAPDRAQALIQEGRMLEGGVADESLSGLDLSADAVRRSPFFSFSYGDSTSPERYSAAAVCTRRFPWVLVTAKPTESFMHPVNTQLRDSIVLAAAIIIVVVLLGLGASAVLTRPLRDLTRVTQRLGDGDLDARARIAGGSEVGAMAMTFNQMAQRLQETVAHLREAVTNLEGLAEERRHLIDELEHRNRELEGVLYATSHDLRAPLVNIQGFSQRVEKAITDLRALPTVSDAGGALLNERIPKALYFIQTSVAKMDTLIGALLQLSRTNRARLHMQLLDMDGILQAVLDSMAFQLQRVGGTAHLETLPACWGDGEQINRVFSNLVDNAVKYRDPDRPLEITISARQDNAMVIYTVADNGKGIAPEHHEQIWLLFHRLAPKGAEAGEGLGLTLTRRIIERHRGRIWVESEEGKGCRFHVELPGEPSASHGLSDDSLPERGVEHS